jgi:hypothetical protein
MADKPKPTSSLAEKELDNAQKQFETFDNQVKDMTMDRMNAAPKVEKEEQTKLSQSEIARSKDIYLKPIRSIGSPQKFNEKFRELWNFDKEYVQFIAENHEIIGEDLDIWTRPYGGVPAEEWKVPVNKPVWGPRYLAEQIKRKFYHRLTMAQNVVTESNGVGQMYGALAVDTTIQRLDARPVSNRKSVFMGANSFG